MRRLFIESDVLKDDDLRYNKRRVRYILEEAKLEHHDTIFDEVIDFAWHEPKKAWEAVKRADEIYADSGLVPLLGYGSYTGSVVVFDVMMQKAIDEDIRGKSVIFLRDFDDIDWDGIELKLLPKAFEHNKLFTIEDSDTIKQVDIKALLKKYKWK